MHRLQCASKPAVPRRRTEQGRGTGRILGAHESDQNGWWNLERGEGGNSEINVGSDSPKSRMSQLSQEQTTKSHVPDPAVCWAAALALCIRPAHAVFQLLPLGYDKRLYWPRG